MHPGLSPCPPLGTLNPWRRTSTCSSGLWRCNWAWSMPGNSPMPVRAGRCRATFAGRDPARARAAQARRPPPHRSARGGQATAARGGNIPTPSIAVSNLDDLRQAIRQAGQPSLCATERNGADGDKLLSSTLAEPMEKTDRYSLNRLHAEGGLGRIYVAPTPSSIARSRSRRSSRRRRQRGNLAAIPARGPGHGPARTPEHRAGLRAVAAQGRRPAVLRHEARPRPDAAREDRRVSPPPQAASGRRRRARPAARGLHQRVPGGRLCPRPGRHPPRPQGRRTSCSATSARSSSSTGAWPR